MESESIYDLLEKESSRVLTTAQRRPASPLGPDDEVLHADLLPMFSAHRMVREYTERFYLPAARRWAKFVKDGYIVTKQWPIGGTAPGEVGRGPDRSIQPRSQEPQVGQQLRSTPRSSSLHQAEEVCVELYYGPLDPRGAITTGASVPLKCAVPTAPPASTSSPAPCPATTAASTDTPCIVPSTRKCRPLQRRPRPLGMTKSC